MIFSDRHKQAVSNARKADIDAAGSAGKILLYPDPQPASGAAASGLLGTITLAYPCGLVDATGLHLTIPGPGQASGSGIVRWARIVDGNGAWVADALVRMVTDSDVASADFIIQQAQVYYGGYIYMLAGAISEG